MFYEFSIRDWLFGMGTMGTILLFIDPIPKNYICMFFLLQLQIGFGSIEERKKIGISAKALQQ